MRLAAFDVFGVDAVVADLGVGHRDDLTAVARIGEDFLIAGHRRVEADFAVDFACGAERGSGEDRAVFQGKLCGFGHCQSVIGHVVSSAVASQGERGKLWRIGAAHGCRLKPLCSGSRYPHYGCGSSDNGATQVRNSQIREASCCGEQETSFFVAQAANSKQF